MYPKDIPIPFPIEFISIPTTNYRDREAGMMPDAIVIHIAEGMKASVVSEFKNPNTQKSSHFLVCRDGKLVQFVSTTKVSFATGKIDNPINELVLQREGFNPNSWSFAIEHEGFSTSDITPAQYAMTARLCKFLHDKWGVPLNRTHIFGHREVISTKICPGLINTDRIIQLARKL